MSSLHVDQLRIARGGHPVITEASFDVPHGTTTVIVGPSGSGKSTLLLAIAGLINVDGGTLQLDDREITYVPTAQRNIGLVFQDNQLFPHLNVADNVAYGLRRKGIRRSECDVRVSEVLQLVGLEGFGGRTPSANFQEERRNGSLSPDHSLRRLNCCCSTNLSPDSMTLSTTACFTTSSMCSPPLKQLRYGSPTIEKKRNVLAHSCFEFMTVSFHLN